MHPFATLIALLTRFVRLLSDQGRRGDLAVHRRVCDPLCSETPIWEPVAAWLGWFPMRAQRAPVYVRRTHPEMQQAPGCHSVVRH